MLKNNFILAFRNLVKNKFNNLFHIIGLTVGLSVALLIFLVVQHELSYDQFQSNKNSIYRLVTENKNSDGIQYEEGIPAPVKVALKQDIPQMSTTTELFSIYGSEFSVLDPKIKINTNLLSLMGHFSLNLNILRYSLRNG